MAEKELDWRDTNVGAIGSAEDKAMRKEAAMTEPAWEGCGLATGTEIWRIEYMKVKAIDKSDYGKFYKGDTYIILSTVENASGTFAHTIYYYIGHETSVDEHCTAAYKTVELDDYFDGEPIQKREVMGDESDAFKEVLNSLPTNEYLEGGVDSGLKEVGYDSGVDYPSTLWHVRKEKNSKKPQCYKRNLKKKNINDHDCFVLDTKDAIYVYDGKNSSPFEKAAANAKAEEIERKRATGVQATHDIDDAFWAALEE